MRKFTCVLLALLLLFTAATPVTGNITVKAKWTTALYTVIFKNGADEYHKIENIPYNTTVMLPTAPTKTGFTFGGWFDEHGSKFTDTTKVTASITVYAKWIPNGTVVYKAPAVQRIYATDDEILAFGNYIDEKTGVPVTAQWVKQNKRLNELMEIYNEKFCK